mgnify:CR=1 FL=1
MILGVRGRIPNTSLIPARMPTVASCIIRIPMRITRCNNKGINPAEESVRDIGPSWQSGIPTKRGWGGEYAFASSIQVRQSQKRPDQFVQFLMSTWNHLSSCPNEDTTERLAREILEEASQKDLASKLLSVCLLFDSTRQVREGWIGPWAGPAKHASNSRERYITSWIAATGVNLIFRASADRQSRECGIETLAEACAKIGWQVHAYVLMPNHFHLVVETPPSPLCRDRRDEMVSPYTSRFNRRPRASSPICSPVATNRWWWLNRGALGDGNSRPSEPPVVSPEAVWRRVAITNRP